MSDLFTRRSKAAEKVFGKLDSELKISEDSLLNKYDNMKPEQFDFMSQTLGFDRTAELIQKMEAKRLKRGANGNQTS